MEQSAVTVIDLGVAIAIGVDVAIGWSSVVAIYFGFTNLRDLDALLANELDVAMIINLDVAMSTSLDVAETSDRM